MKARLMIGSVSSRCSGMSPRSSPERLSVGKHGLISEQRLDTEPRLMREDKKIALHCEKSNGFRQSFNCFTLRRRYFQWFFPYFFFFALGSQSYKLRFHDFHALSRSALCTFAIGEYGPLHVPDRIMAFLSSSFKSWRTLTTPSSPWGKKQM